MINRFQATTISLLFGLIVFTALLFVLLTYWYPGAYFTAAGGWQGFKIIAMIDLVLGPLLTFVIFNRQKTGKQLYFDLSIITILRLSALVWGIYTIHAQRPVAAVFWDSYFYTVTAAEMKEQQTPVEQLKKYGDDFPVYVYCTYPENLEQWQSTINYMLSSNMAPYLQTECYRLLSENYENVFKKSIDMKEIIIVNQNAHIELEKLLEQTDTRLENNYYIPLESKYRNVILVFDASNKLIGSVNAPYKNN